VPKEGNIYDLVEHAAARRSAPRLELWEVALRALTDKTLRPSNLDLAERPNPVASPSITYGDWLNGILHAVVSRRFDPNSVAHIFRNIIVRYSDFESLLRKGNIGGRGPKPGDTGLKSADRKLFPQLKRLIKRGKARSPYGAALTLADKIGGEGTRESRAKRASALYRKECPKSR
jgi:hypothetical protein